MSKKPVDVLGREIMLGDTVARATMWGNSPCMAVCKVTNISGECVWLDDSPKAIIYNNRLAVIEVEK